VRQGNADSGLRLGDDGSRRTLGVLWKHAFVRGMLFLWPG